jgi:hypothetical protein
LVVVHKTIEDAAEVVEAECEWTNEGRIGEHEGFVEVP